MMRRRRLAMLSLMLASLACGLAVGCEERKPQTLEEALDQAFEDAIARQRNRPLVDVLGERRLRAQSAAGVDPLVSERMGEIIAVLERDGPDALRARPMAYVATVNYDSYTPGADRLYIDTVGPPVAAERVEILDEQGRVLAVSRAFQSGLSQYEAEGLGITPICAYVVPSVYAPALGEQAARKLQEPDELVFEPLALPDDWHERTLSARVVYGDGATAHAIPLYIDAGPPSLREALRERRQEIAETDRAADDDVAPLIGPLDAALAALDADPQALQQRPITIEAEARSVSFMAGMNSLGVLALGPIRTPLRVEVLDESGVVIASTPAGTTSWDAIDDDAGLGLASVQAEVYPGSRRKVSGEELYRELDEIAKATDNAWRIEPLVLPVDWAERSLSVRLVYEGELVSGPAPLQPDPMRHLYHHPGRRAGSP